MSFLSTPYSFSPMCSYIAHASFRPLPKTERTIVSFKLLDRMRELRTYVQKIEILAVLELLLLRRMLNVT